jgi:hypothetical protein
MLLRGRGALGIVRLWRRDAISGRWFSARRANRVSRKDSRLLIQSTVGMQ